MSSVNHIALAEIYFGGSPRHGYWGGEGASLWPGIQGVIFPEVWATSGMHPGTDTNARGTGTGPHLGLGPVWGFAQTGLIGAPN